MTQFIFIKYLHLLSILIMVSSLAMEWMLVSRELPRKTLDRLSRIDALYGISSVLAVTFGLIMWFGIGKPSNFYTENPVFLTKVGILIGVAILSLWPTVFYLKKRKGDPEEMVLVPPHIRLLIPIQLTILLFIPLLAVTMSHGLRWFW